MEFGDIKLLVDPVSITQCRSGKFLGVIRWQIDQYYFPSELWDDFVLTLLTDWIQAYIRLMTRTSHYEVLHFMDGPFYIRCKVSNDKVFCKFIESGASGKEFIECKWQGNPQVIASSLIHASDIVLSTSAQFKNCDEVFRLLASRRYELQNISRLSNF
jgi:hypothetical protein